MRFEWVARLMFAGSVFFYLTLPLLSWRLFLGDVVVVFLAFVSWLVQRS